jgi:hypothetical protein
MLGAARTQRNGVPLPIDLTVVGMPGCSLLQSGEIVGFRLADGSGTAAFQLPIPPAPALLGFDVFTQSFVLDAGANPPGWLASAAIALTIGQ